MGKAEIISASGDGLYTITVKHDTTTADLMLSRLAMVISFIDGTLSKATDPNEIAALKLRKAAVEKRIAAITEARNADYNTQAWCADYTENLSGEVGTIEIGAEFENGLNIRPGYADDAVFSKVRDGQATPFLTMHVADAMRNFAIMPAIQKWRPTYRYGVASNVDKENSTCSVTLEGCWSSIQNLDINHETQFDNVPIEYMNCNGMAFENGDNVLVKWEPYNTTGQVTVIGFKDHPTPCEGGPYVVINTQYGTAPHQFPSLRSIIIWDIASGDYAKHDDFDGLEWPLTWSQVANFLSALELIPSNSMWAPISPGIDHEGEIPTDYVYGAEYRSCPSDEGGGYENQGVSSYDVLAEHEWYMFSDLWCQEFFEPCHGYGMDGFIKTTEIVMPAVTEEPNETRPWGVYSYILNPVLNPGWGQQELRLQHEVDLLDSLPVGTEDGGCFWIDERTYEYRYSFESPIGGNPIVTDYYHYEHDKMVSYSLQPYKVDDRYLLRDFEQLVTCIYSDKIFVQLYALFCRRYETQKVSDGTPYAVQTTIRQEYVNEAKCVAAADFYNDEGGTSTRHPSIQNRDSGLENAIEALMLSVYDDGHKASNLWVTLYQNEEV